MSLAKAAILGASLWIMGTSPAAEQTSEFRAETVTVARIHDIGLRIEEYGLQHNGKAPPSLGALGAMFDLPAERLQDGWGRGLYYDSTGSQCMVVSCGKNGLPEPQVSPAGGSVPQRDHDADVVWIQGEWAQTPDGIGR